MVQPGEAMELLLPIEMEAREMVSTLLEGLPELLGRHPEKKPLFA